MEMEKFRNQSSLDSYGRYIYKCIVGFILAIKSKGDDERILRIKFSYPGI